MQSISLERAEDPFVLAIDVGTSSARALFFDRHARQIDNTESQIPWDLIETADGGLVADAEALFDLVCTTVDQVLPRIRGEIAAVGMSCFWHSMMGLDADREPITPVYMWIDSRSRHAAKALRDDRDLARRMRFETGCRPHSSYWPAKLTWLRETDPDLFSRVRHWVSFADYVMLRLNGELSTSVAMASGTGLLDVASCAWHGAIAERFGIKPTALPPLVDRMSPLPPLQEPYRSRWPSLHGVTWYPSLGDGAAANVGAGCVGADRIAMTIGTSAAMRVIVPADAGPSPDALWDYRLDRAHRVIGGALSNGGNVSGWLAQLTADGDIASLSREAESVAPDGHGLTCLPFFAGERSPSWDDEATGSVVGLRFTSTRADLFRAALEGTAYRLAAVYGDLQTIAAPDHAIHANGGAALNSPLWMQIIADAFNHAIEAGDADAEVSARGAAVSALEACGILPNLRPDAIAHLASFAPDSARHGIYAAARNRQSAYESAIARTYQQIRTT